MNKTSRAPAERKPVTYNLFSIFKAEFPALINGARQAGETVDISANAESWMSDDSVGFSLSRIKNLRR
jgi:hypothetical protein